MPASLPDGDPVPADGSLPAAALTEVGARGFGVYLHVPFCVSRCGYCDFNTYAPGDGVARDGYLDAVLGELAIADRVLDGAHPSRVDTVFVGGGTPTVLSTADLGRMVERIDATWGLAPDAEVTTEANPESVDHAALRALRKAGFTRISLGMQSVAPHVLAVLDRQHRPERALQAVAEARDAGFEHVNLDLIYGTPGETAEDFAQSLAAVLASGVDHLSAYALTVEEGTRLAHRIRRGDLTDPDDDVAADRYVMADEVLSAAGLRWYEVSNWARGPAARCRHNLGYWQGADWWGLGPGAHSHVGGVRWWNVRHPSAYRERISNGQAPGAGREVLTTSQRYAEEVLLGVRLASGLAVPRLAAPARAQVTSLLADGLVEADAWRGGRLVLTLSGRLLADAVVRRLLP